MQSNLFLNFRLIVKKKEETDHYFDADEMLNIKRILDLEKYIIINNRQITK